MHLEMLSLTCKSFCSLHTKASKLDCVGYWKYRQKMALSWFGGWWGNTMHLHWPSEHWSGTNFEFRRFLFNSLSFQFDFLVTNHIIHVCSADQSHAVTFAIFYSDNMIIIPIKANYIFQDWNYELIDRIKGSCADSPGNGSVIFCFAFLSVTLDIHLSTQEPFAV